MDEIIKDKHQDDESQPESTSGAKIVDPEEHKDAITHLYASCCEIKHDEMTQIMSYNHLEFLSLHDASYFIPMNVQIIANHPTIKTLILGYTGVEHREILALSKNTTVTSLNLVGNNIDDAGAEALASNTTIQELFLTLNDISNTGAKSLARNTTLKTLYIDYNRIGEEGVDALARNTNLTTLCIQKTDATSYIQPMLYGRQGWNNNNDSLDWLFVNLVIKPVKKVYSVLYNFFSSPETRFDNITTLSRNTTLTKLSLSNNSVDDEQAIILAKNSTLITLDLSINKIGDDGVKALAANTTLKTLNLRSNCIGHVGVEYLANNRTLTTLNIDENMFDNRFDFIIGRAFSENRVLTTLKMNYTKINDSTIESLAFDHQRNSNWTLATLEIAYSLVTDKGIKCITQSTRINTLDISDNVIYLTGIRALADDNHITELTIGKCGIDDMMAQILSGNTTIKTLNIFDNKIGDMGAKALALNRDFKVLNLRNNKIGDEGAQFLSDNTTLRSLDLSGNDIRSAGVCALAMNSTIVSLYLTGKNLCTTSLEAFDRNNTLRVLHIGYPEIRFHPKKIMENRKLYEILVDAVTKNDLEMARKLLEMNVSPNPVHYIEDKYPHNSARKTLIDVARDARWRDMIRLLVENGAD